MKIKIYERFIEILETDSIQLKYFRISLCRTYLFGSKKDICFRKYIMPRRMIQVAKEKQFKCISTDLSIIDLNKNHMRLNNNVLLEFVSCPFIENNNKTQFDIAKKQRNNFRIDSLKNDGVTSMYFKGIKDTKYDNILWINVNNKTNYNFINYN